MKTILLQTLWRGTSLLAGLGLLGIALLVGAHAAGVVGPRGLVGGGVAIELDFSSLTLAQHGVWLAIAVLAVALGLLLVVGAVARSSEAGRQVVLSGAAGNGHAYSGGQVTVALSSLQALVAHVAEQTPGVREAVPALRLKRAGWYVRCRVALRPHAALPDVIERLKHDLRAALEQHTGLPVARVDIATQLEAIDAHRRVR